MIELKLSLSKLGYPAQVASTENETIEILIILPPLPPPKLRRTPACDSG